MDDKAETLAHHIFRRAFRDLPEAERRTLTHLAQRRSRHAPSQGDAGQTFGERLSDQIAAFGGSWTFILLFLGFLFFWICANLWWLTHPADPYPFIFLNLILSMVAAVQAPVIMMSQNRQSAKDRIAAEQDYQVNLKAEFDIVSLHEKLDELRHNELTTHFARLEERLTAIEHASGMKPGGNETAQ